ncbi:L-lactate dehydrogenase [Melghirimyces algeriensis]|uniref:L-lactate dehydrogenase n=1 Tax=Melghirimyces algeriensis TaxID=910412 RepID=A0A521EU05_9BACL|nr:L-lactate dehydrogenase [Melghirimyces algeriensis]SMO86590.1 L-lactate dehydrogenase [Melghirimyces algeriensis]
MSQPRKVSRIVVVGTGFVGSSYAYACFIQGLCHELVLVDVNEEKAIGDAMDLNHGLPFARTPMTIRVGNYSDCKDADLVVLTAGANQGPGETRLDLVAKNARIFRSIIDSVMENGFNGIFLVATNPVDVLSYVTWKYSGLPSERVIGTGTILDTARFRYLLGQAYHVDTRNVHAYIIGEHGDTELPVWSLTDIGRRSIAQYLKDGKGPSQQELDNLFIQVRDAAYHIIQAKGATYYGIGMGLARLTQAVLENENSIHTVSCLAQGEYGLEDVYIGLPAVINQNGIREVIELKLNESETKKLQHSATVLSEVIHSALPSQKT